MLTAFLYMLGINACVGLAGFAFGRLTAPDKVVTIIHEPPFDLRPSADVIPFKGRVR